MALLSLYLLLYSWCRIVLTWITSFPLSFRCVLISFLRFRSFSLVPSTFLYKLFARDYLLYSLFHSLCFSFSLFVSFECFLAFLCLFFSFSVLSLFSLFFFLYRFFFCVRQRVLQFWSTHFSSSSSFVFLWRSRLLSCITLFTSMWQLVRTKLATNTIIRTKLSIISKFWKVSLCCHFFYLPYQNFWNWPTV